MDRHCTVCGTTLILMDDGTYVCPNPNCGHTHSSHDELKGNDEITIKTAEDIKG